MRGGKTNQPSMLMLVSPGSLVPPNHPLRAIKKLADAALKDLDATFDAMYSDVGRHSTPPERLLKTLLLMVLFSVRSERQVCEQLQYNMLFRWFVDMDLTEPAFDASTFSKNRDRLIEHDVASRFLEAIVEQARKAGLLSNDHFSVDGTLIGAMASHKSIKPKDPGPGDSGGDSNGWSDFKGEKRSNDTHASTTDPDSRLARKSVGVGAELSYAVNALMENRNGLIIDIQADIASGTIERDAALKMIDHNLHGGDRITLGADKAYDTKAFVAALRERSVTPHVAQNVQPGRRKSNIDMRTTRHPGYQISLIKRRLIEPIFGWMKHPGRMKRARYRGLPTVGWFAKLAGAAFNLVKISNISRAMQAA
jgi:transposase